MGLACKCRQSMLARGGTISNPITEIMNSLSEQKLVKKAPKKAPKKVKPKTSKTNKQKKKDLKGEGETSEDITKYLLDDKKIPKDMVEKFMESKKTRGWNQTFTKAFNVYEEWLKVYREEEEKKKAEEKDEKEEKAPPPKQSKLSKKKITEHLKSKGIDNEDLIKRFLGSRSKEKGWNESEDTAYEAYEDWLKTYREEEKEEEITKKLNDWIEENKMREKDEKIKKKLKDWLEEKKREEKKDEKDEKAPPPKPTKAVFKLDENTFRVLRNTNPRIEWKQVLKAFIAETGLTSFSQVPGNFVNEVNALGIGKEGEASDKQIEALTGIINTYRPIAAHDNKSKTEVVLPKSKPVVKKPKEKVERTISNKVEVKKPVKRRATTSDRKKKPKKGS